jgi:hypothetical protein
MLPLCTDDIPRADDLIDDIHHYDFRTAPLNTTWASTYGTSGLGLDLSAEAWPTLTQTFRSELPGIPTETPGRPPCLELAPVERLPQDVLTRHPVDVLVMGQLSETVELEWLTRVGKASPQPRIIFEFWDETAVFKEGGPMSKSVVTRWENIGYSSSCSNVNSTQVGGVVDRFWLIAVRYKRKPQDLELVWPPVTEEIRRPMSNCLRPANVPGRAYRHDLRTDAAKLRYPHEIPNCEEEAPMPAWPGSLIGTTKGTRRLLNDELARGLGVTKPWLDKAYPKGGSVRRTPAVHILEYLGQFLVNDSSTDPDAAVADQPPTEASPPQDQAPFTWHPPDLGPLSPWTRQRVFNLLEASMHYEEPGPIIESGLQDLRRHRTNYDSEGPRPKNLQLLWWEFPRESWDELRGGCPMNFLRNPSAGITPNSEMTPEQITIAAEFVEELVSLGVLIPVKPGEMISNGPIFCLPKPGQPGQWRVLSDMRRGGQNAAVGADPTVFPKSGVILDQLYTRGYSAVVDASKFFYNFPT